MTGSVRRVKNYAILAELSPGSGTYVAQDEAAGRKVVLKELDSSTLASPQQVQTFRAAVKKLAQAAPHCVAKTFELLQLRFEGRIIRYLVREYREGVSLEELAHRHRAVPSRDAARLTAAAARAIGAMHSAGIAHGNLAPGNVVIDHSSQVHLTDYLLPRGPSNGAFTAPEIASGGPSSPAGDLYALGALYCVLLTGQAPAGNSLPETARDAAGPAADVLARLMAHQPERRPTDALAVAALLEQRSAAAPETNATIQPHPIRPPAPAPAAAPPRPPAAVAAEASLTELASRSSESPAPPSIPSRLGRMAQRAVGAAQVVVVVWAVGFLFLAVGRHALTAILSGPSTAARPVYTTAATPGSPAAKTAQPSTPQTTASPVALDCEMRSIPAGDFIFLNPATNRRERASLPAYEIDRYEVTNAEYLRFTRETGTISDGNWQRYFLPGMERHPVVGVSWKDADAYAKWAGKRLPTAQEWQKAAGGPEGLPYPWGLQFDPLRCCYSRAAKPVPVDAFPEGQSPFGVFNMAGNVWEWVTDSAGGRRFVMGGSFQSEPVAVGTLARLPVPGEGFRSPADFGFRCVR